MWMVVLFGGLFATCAGFYCLGRSTPAEATATTQPEPTIQNDQPPSDEIPADVTAKKLFSDYSENEVSADALYKNKLLRVSGTVRSIDKNLLNDIVVRLSAGQMFESVAAFLPKSQTDAAAKLRKGQPITVLCRGRGMVMRTPDLKSCQILSGS